MNYKELSRYQGIRNYSPCKILSLTFAAILSLMFLPAAAQLKADFTADTLVGCPPVIVSFTDQSAGNPVSWKWNFGNGNTSSLQNPQTVYTTPGTYTVTLTTSDGIHTDQVVKQSYITVSDTPNVRFLVSPASGCYPLEVHFKDGSSPGSDHIQSWLWDFGDGTLSSQPNPSHVYNDAGRFNVTLSVTNSAGCTSGMTSRSAVITNEGVKADFSADRTFSCSAPMQVHFQAQTNSTEGEVTYLWDFGDGTTGTGAGPEHTYTQEGAYTVILKASIVSGCTDTVVRENLIHVGTYKTNFKLPEGCAKTPLTFSNTSIPLPDSAIWYFSDGAVVKKINAVHQFNTPGTYTVKLVNIYGNCKDTLTKTITTFPSPKAAFQTAVQKYCGLPVSVSFANLSEESTSWLWDFGDGATATGQQPTHIYREEGDFDVKLTVKNEQGCVDSVVKVNYIQLYAPKIHFKASAISGCIPLQVTFKNEVESREAITGYFWDFGDGQTSSAANPVHTYTKEGTYNVMLKIVTASGCADSLIRESFIHTGTVPTVNFEATPKVSCMQTPVRFTNLSKPPGVAWEWQFPDDDDATETSENPLHRFHHLGKQDVTLNVNNNGCMGSLTKTDLITIEPPKAAMRITRSCTDPYTVHFTDESKAVESWHWDFGDGTVSNRQNPPPHQYKATGKYQVTLTVKNKGCTSISKSSIYIIDEHPVLKSSGNVLCHGTTMEFSAGNISDTALIRSYTWITGDGRRFTTEAPLKSWTYKKNGTYNARVVTTNLNGCKDTSAVYPIVVRGPEAGFSVSSPASCPGTKVSFKDESTTSGAAIRQWSWDFGDGETDSLMVDSVTHTYLQGGKYKVQLIVTDESGCSDVLTRLNAVSVYAAKAGFSTTDTLICPGAPIHWDNTSQGSDLKYLWHFGDGTTSDDAFPSKTYSEEGTYSVSLRIETKDGCRDSVKKAGYIQVGKPHAAMIYSDNKASCPPFVVSVVNRSKNYRKILWDFGDGTLSHREDTAQHVYNIPGNYRLRMLAYGYSGGCVDSIVRTVSVAGPYGTASVMDSVGCSPHRVRFSARAVNTVSYRWDFGDGNVSQTASSDAAMHTYEEAGVFRPKLILTDDRNCTVAIPAKHKVTVDGITAQPVFTRPEICDSAFIQFKTKGLVFSADSLGMSAAYRWNFGEPGSPTNTSADRDPTHRYQQPATYQAALQITTAYGCISRDTVAVPVPEPHRLNITASPDTAVCRGIPALLQASGGYRYVWSPVTGLNDPDDASPLAVPDSTTVYQVVGYSKGDCQSDTDRVRVTVYNNPSVILPADTTIGTGSVIRLPASFSPDVISRNWTPTDYLSCSHCANPLSTPRKPVTYKVIASNASGCTDTAAISIKLVCANGKVFIPNTFTPNHDGMNDIFYPRGRGVREVLYFRIYNRWGQLIYERTHFQLNDKSAGWDGTFKGQPFTPGVFVYQSAMICDNGERFQMNGDITLVR